MGLLMATMSVLRRNTASAWLEWGGIDCFLSRAMKCELIVRYASSTDCHGNCRVTNLTLSSYYAAYSCCEGTTYWVNEALRVSV